MTSENTFNLKVSESDAGKRLDKYLSENIIELSRSRIQGLIEEKSVKINQKIIDNSNYKTCLSDEITIELPEAKPSKLSAKTDITLDVVFEDKYLMVINKQAGLTVHPGAGNFDDTLVNALIARLGENLSSINGVLRPGIVHRLDRDTTGLILIAKTDEAHQSLSAQLKEREIKRIYHAVVWNKPDIKVGKIATSIARSKVDRTKMSIYKTFGKQAVTHYTLLNVYFEGILSLLEFRLETGRTHQIRVHAEHKKMPLLGDKTYSGQPSMRKYGKLPEKIKNVVLEFPRQALHAKKIEFTHPINGKLMKFEIDYPKDMKELLKKFAKYEG
jgi:23S rRNA pseudouridine1911/1915/1917 synthase